MNPERDPIVVVPCSGIGKALGSVSREAAYELCDDLRPGTARLLALSKLVLGDEDARNRLHAGRAVTIDGCKLMCAAKLVEHNGGTFLRKVAVLDIYREHAHLKPEGIAELNEAGRELARVIARDVAQTIDGAVGSEGDTSHG